jgi:hypothetical protein
VLLYAYAVGVRSSRQVERRCQEEVAFRVLADNATPDHVTIARFRGPPRAIKQHGHIWVDQAVAACAPELVSVHLIGGPVRKSV